MADLLASALQLEKAGQSVIPVHMAEGKVCSCGRPDCDRAGKHPRVAWEPYQQRRASPGEIEAWWRQWPNANVGIVTGRISDLVVLDIDSEQGREYARGRHLPQTPVASTGRGWHYYYRHPGFEVRNFAKRVPGIDLRGDGGYVLAPPSLHPSGRHYEWLIPPEQSDLAPMPEWLLELCQGPAEAPTAKEGPDWIEQAWQGVVEGGRNEVAARLAGHYLRQGMSEREVLLLLGGWNDRNRPPLPERELAAVVHSITRREREGGGRNFEIERIQKFVADHPVYRIRIFGCDVDIPGDAIYSFSRVKQLVVQAADRVPRLKRSSDWESYLHALLSSRLELLETPPEASESVVLWGRIARYLRQTASEDAESLADGRGVYSNDAHIYFHGPSVKAHLESVGQPIKAMAFWQLVREHGGRQADQQVRLPDGARRHVRCWSVPKVEVDITPDVEEEVEI